MSAEGIVEVSEDEVRRKAGRSTAFLHCCKAGYIASGVGSGYWSLEQYGKLVFYYIYIILSFRKL